MRSSARQVAKVGVGALLANGATTTDALPAGQRSTKPDPGNPAALLGADEAIEFWDARHRARGPLRSGGDLSFDQPTNEILYALRLGRLIDVLGDVSSVTAPLRMLDAGCGKGYYTRAMASFGHRVDGIDASEYAIEYCRVHAVGGEMYEVSTVAAWRPPYLYDVVFSIDVLFHVMDDALWEDSVCNLGSLLRWGGRLVLADHDDEHDRVWGDYQKTRAPARYRDVLSPSGFRSDGHVPYRFRDSRVGFNVFTRVA
jgi:SAM-dependent methyltransferase